VKERDALVAVIDPEHRRADALGREAGRRQPPMKAPSMCVTAVFLSCHSNSTPTADSASAQCDVVRRIVAQRLQLETPSTPLPR
jgi:hypothetical protein